MGEGWAGWEALLTTACGSWGMRSVLEEAALAFHLKAGPRPQGWGTGGTCRTEQQRGRLKPELPSYLVAPV